MKEKLSRQKEIIVETLRDMQWHCGREWLDQIKDDRKRIQELNDSYMLEKGFVIKGEPCKGTICGIQKCHLYKRRAEKLLATPQTNKDHETMMAQNKINLQFFNEYSVQR